MKTQYQIYCFSSMNLFHRLTLGSVILLAFTACGRSNQDTNPTAFQPTQTQPNRTQPVQTQPIQTQINSTEPNKTQLNPAQASKTQTIQTEAVPFQPTLTQVNQAQQQLNAQVTPQEIRISLPADVLFNFDKADIRPDAAQALRQTLTVIRYYKEAPIQIEGHTDSKGSDGYNQALSERRAQSVQQWLVSQGNVSASSITTQGYGESRPRVQNTQPDGSDDPVGRQLNRRVEIIIQKQ